MYQSFPDKYLDYLTSVFTNSFCFTGYICTHHYLRTNERARGRLRTRCKHSYTYVYKHTRIDHWWSAELQYTAKPTLFADTTFFGRTVCTHPNTGLSVGCSGVYYKRKRRRRRRPSASHGQLDIRFFFYYYYVIVHCVRESRALLCICRYEVAPLDGNGIYSYYII